MAIIRTLSLKAAAPAWRSGRKLKSFATTSFVGMLALTTITLALTTLAFAQPEKDPTDIIKDLERKKPEAPMVLPPSSPTPSPSPSAPATLPVPTSIEPLAVAGNSGLVREGSFISSRKGRMTRAGDGQWAFTFDSDARTGAARTEPAMMLMPCTNLQNMERVIERAGEGLTFTISGQVFVYKGRNYLLPTIYQINRRGDLNSAQ
jgi:hypothetical protein